MPNYRYCTLYSGSTGNAAYIETPHARILIDAGKCTRTLVSSLASIGVDIDTVDAIFITHEHSDHVASLEVLAKKHPIPVHILYNSALRYSQNPPPALCSVLQIYRDAPYTARVGDVTVTAFPTPHDSRAAVGYRFEFPDGDRTVCLGYATDIGKPTFTVTDALCGCRAVILEANYDKDMLRQGPYPLSLKQRIGGDHGHMDNETSAKFCAFLGKRGTERILLAHLSNENNTPDVAYQTVLKKLKEENLSLSLGVADRYTPTELITLPLC